LEGQKRNAKRQANSSAFARSGTSVSAEGVVTVDGTLSVVGDLDVSGNADVTGPLAVHGTAAFDGATTIGGTLGVTGPATIGGTLGVTGATTLSAPTTVSGSLGVTGPMTVTGTLSLPAGIIDNAALTSPVKPIASHADSGASSFPVTTTMTNQATATVTVPAGYTQALILAVGQASAVNTTASLDTVYVGVSINAVSPPGWASGQDVGPSGFGGATSAVAQLLTGLTGGGTFTIAARIRSAFAGWSANASNEANIDASVLFLR